MRVLILLIFGGLVAVFIMRKVIFSSKIMPFSQFAYEKAERIPVSVHPTRPWQAMADVPLFYEKWASSLPWVQPLFTREANYQQEIWLSTQSPDGSNFNFLIYFPESQEWESISNQTANRNLRTKSLFVDSSGVIWGKVLLDRGQIEHGISQPLLLKFNEETRIFEPYNLDTEYPLVISDYFNEYEIHILPSEESGLWIFIKEDAIYLYDTSANEIEKHVDLPKGDMSQPILSPDGTVVFADVSDYSGVPTLFKYDPYTEKMVQVQFPSKYWSGFAGMLYDNNNRLWFGAKAI